MLSLLFRNILRTTGASVALSAFGVTLLERRSHSHQIHEIKTQSIRQFRSNGPSAITNSRADTRFSGGQFSCRKIQMIIFQGHFSVLVEANSESMPLTIGVLADALAPFFYTFHLLVPAGFPSEAFPVVAIDRPIPPPL